MLRFGASIGLLVLLLVAWSGGGISTVRPAQAEELDYDIIGGHFFTQANGQGGAGGTGFAVTNEGGIRFWDEFRRLGGVEVIGYPISTRFIWNGFTVQAFQKIVLQWRPEVGEAYFVNVVDEMHNRGLDEALAVSRSTPAIADWAADAGLSWDQVVEHHRAVLVADPALQAKYFSVDDPTLRFGLPMAPIADYGSVAVLRAQRVILQHWKVQTPWANPGDVVIANGADVAKELGVFDPQVLTPQPAPPAAARSTRYGIVAHPGAPRQLQALREAGASLTVLEVLWRDVEPSPTGPAQFDWSRIDPLFENVRSAGVLPVVLVQGNPTWAWAPGDSGVIHPDRYGDFAEFVHALVT
ncbi:MAG TPA: hypothetical protein VHL09_02235, partial [Dehalococcoidia bacterium]|nr:hypothetical protein [Dehalococcoidia bacterium]